MSIRNKLILFISGLLSAAFLIAGWISYNQTANMLSHRVNDFELPATVVSVKNNIEKRLNVFLIASQGIASNTYVLDWFARGEPKEEVDAWIDYARKLVADTNSSSITFASAETRSYYGLDGYNKQASEEMVYWFDGFIERGNPYEMVLDTSVVTGGARTLYTNVRVEHAGKIASVGLGVNVDKLAKDIENIVVGKTGYVFLTTKEGQIKIHQEESLVGEASLQDMDGISSIADSLLETPANADENHVNIAKYNSPDGEMIVGASWIPSIQSHVVVVVPGSEIYGGLWDSLLTIGLIVLVIFAASLVVVYFIATRMSSPIKAMTDVVSELASGKTNLEVPGQDYTDEIGGIARAVEVFRQGMIEKINLEEEQLQAAQRSEEEKRHLLNQMADNFETSVGSIVHAVSNSSDSLNNSAQTMTSLSQETQNKATNVATASEEASGNVQTVASATEELTASSTEISTQVATSASIARDAVEQAEISKENIGELISSAKKIGEVVSLITEIADQTNLLALNATIEAARAGDAGKGFAVVANEVKSLANQTAKATDEIRSQVDGIQASTQHAADSIENIGQTINKIDEISSSVAAAVEEQTAATHEIARNVEQAAHGTSQVSDNINGVNVASGEVGDVAHQVLQAAEELGNNSLSLKQEIDKFLQQVRAD